MKRILLACAVALLAGCATNYTKTTTAPDGTRTVEARAKSFAAGKSQLKEFNARNAKDSQSIGLGSMANESDATALTAVLGQVMLDGLKAYMTGGMAPASRSAPTIPAGYKLIPKDDHSTPQPEIGQ